jgi:RNA polymerase sigma factor (sigma-70 family)
MKQIVIMPGGFHPFHAGHYALYKSALEAFPNADVYVAATNDQSERPFPFAIKEKLAKLAGVAPGRFIQVKSPFQSKEITQNYNPEEDVLIFVRSEKDRNEQPKPGGTKKDGSPAYFQPWTGKDLKPFGKHAYIDYLPTVEFGPGIKSATEIRNAWPGLNDRQKAAMVMSLYPATQKNQKLVQNVIKLLDLGMGTEVQEAASPNQQLSIYNPDGDTYRGEKMPTLKDKFDIYNRKEKVDIDTLPDEPSDEPNMDNSIKDLIQQRMEVLNKNERNVLKLRYWHDLTHEEIAQKIGVSTARIAQLEAKAIRKMMQSSLDLNPNKLMKMYVPESSDYLPEK